MFRQVPRSFVTWSITSLPTMGFLQVSLQERKVSLMRLNPQKSAIMQVRPMSFRLIQLPRNSKLSRSSNMCSKHIFQNFFRVMRRQGYEPIIGHRRGTEHVLNDDVGLIHCIDHLIFIYVDMWWYLLTFLVLIFFAVFLLRNYGVLTVSNNCQFILLIS